MEIRLPPFSALNSPTGFIFKDDIIYETNFYHDSQGTIYAMRSDGLSNEELEISCVLDKNITTFFTSSYGTIQHESRLTEELFMKFPTGMVSSVWLDIINAVFKSFNSSYTFKEGASVTSTTRNININLAGSCYFNPISKEINVNIEQIQANPFVLIHEIMHFILDKMRLQEDRHHINRDSRNIMFDTDNGSFIDTITLLRIEKLFYFFNEYLPENSEFYAKYFPENDTLIELQNINRSISIEVAIFESNPEYNHFKLLSIIHNTDLSLLRNELYNIEKGKINKNVKNFYIKMFESQYDFIQKTSPSILKNKKGGYIAENLKFMNTNRIENAARIQQILKTYTK